MAYLFDTNALSEVFRPRPNPTYTRWLQELPRELQFTSTVVVAELYAAAFRIPNGERWRQRIEDVILPAISVLPFDLDCARECGEIQAGLLRRGRPIDTTDVQIAATARVHGLIVVTANAEHFERIPDLRLEIFKPGRQSSP